MPRVEALMQACGASIVEAQSLPVRELMSLDHRDGSSHQPVHQYIDAGASTQYYLTFLPLGVSIYWDRFLKRAFLPTTTLPLLIRVQISWGF